MADTRQHRPDLERLPVAQRPGYITGRLFPMLPKGSRQGTQYYSDIEADVAAQTGRSAGTAPNQETLSDQKTTFNLEDDEFIKRIEVPDDDIAGLGGLNPAQQKAARKGKRSVGNAIEDLTASNVLDNASVSYNDIGSSIIDAVTEGMGTVMDYEGDGPVALVISFKLFHLIKRYTEIKDAMAYTGVPTSTLRDVRGVRPNQVAAALGVDEVILGNNTQWYSQSATYQDRAAVVKLPEPSMEPDEDVQVGRTLWFSPTGLMPQTGQLYEVHAWYSEDEISEMVDVRAYAEQKVFNDELIYGLSGIDGELTS